MGKEKEILRENIVRVPITAIQLIDRLCLLGPPGVGKTEIIRRLAEEEAKQRKKIFVDVRAASEEQLKAIIENPEKYYLYMRVIAPQVTPEDLGIPQQNEKYVEFKLLKYFYLFTLPKIEGILFIDELNNVQRDDVLTMFFALIQEHELGYNAQLSPNVRIVVAGNETQWSEVARALPWPLINRMTVLYVAPGSIDDWMKYMEERSKREGRPWEKRTYAYLKLNSSHFLMPPPAGAENINFPTPRAWTELAFLLPTVKDEKLAEALCVGRLGPEVGLQLAGFLASHVDEALVDSVLQNPPQFDTLKVGERINLLYILAQKDVKALKNHLNFFTYLRDNHKEMLMIFLVLMPREKRIKFISETYKTLIEGFLDSMLPYLQ